MYQGEELGLPEVEDVPPERMQDPMHFQSGGTDPGRDGCRVPLPWDGRRAAVRFGPRGITPWLPQPASWSASRSPPRMATPCRCSRSTATSSLSPVHLVGVDDTLHWITAEPGVLAFRRGDVACIVNLSPGPVQLPAESVLITSGPLDEGRLPVDSAAWVHLENQQQDQEQ